MTGITPKTKGDRIGWEAKGGTAQIFGAMCGNPQCQLCQQNPGVIYRKGHKRTNGIILEAGTMYCEECSNTRAEEVEENFEKWWAEKWAESEARAEENWKNHGVYTNVGGKSGPSKYFGYVKMPDGSFRPYRYEHPESPRDFWERDFDDEMARVAKLEVPDKEKFETLKKFLSEYETDDKNILAQITHETKRVNEYLENLATS